MFISTQRGITQDMLDAIAGDRVTFEAWTKDRRGGGKIGSRIRPRMLLAQDGVCVKCGNDLDISDAEFAHLIPKGFFGGNGNNGGKRQGWVNGNITVWHKGCNDAHGESVTTIEMLARPELVWVGEWKDLPFLPK